MIGSVSPSLDHFESGCHREFTEMASLSENYTIHVNIRRPGQEAITVLPVVAINHSMSYLSDMFNRPVEGRKKG